MSTEEVTVYNSPLTNYDVAVEDIGGAAYQKLKLIDATAESEAPIGITANPLVVTDTVHTLAEATPAYGTAILAAAITGSFATLLNPAGALKKLQVDNSLNFDIYISFDAGVGSLRVGAFKSFTIDFAASRLKMSGVIQVKYVSAPPSPTGFIVAMGWK